SISWLAALSGAPELLKSNRHPVEPACWFSSTMALVVAAAAGAGAKAGATVTMTTTTTTPMARSMTRAITGVCPPSRRPRHSAPQEGLGEGDLLELPAARQGAVGRLEHRHGERPLVPAAAGGDARADAV